MKRLVEITWIMVVALFVGTSPHAVAATFSMRESNPSISCATGWIQIETAKKIAKEIGKRQALAEFNSIKEWDSLYELWMRESKWDYTAKNSRSTAFGIPQILDMPRDTDMETQIKLGISYIVHRYDTPTKALQFHNRNGWY